MKIQITFTYNNVKYRKTIDENNVDMEHYEYLWDYWFGYSANNLGNIKSHQVRSIYDMDND